MVSGDTKAVADWLVDGARSAAEPHQVLAELCDRLVGCGIALWRVAVFVRTLHPEVMGRRFLWRQGGDVTVTEAPNDLIETTGFRDSPVGLVYASGVGFRRRFADPDCPVDFPILRDLRDEGVTDYLASPLIFTDGAIHAATWTTRQVGGFTAAEIAGIEATIAPLARVAEVRALRRTAGILLDTYVGHQAGERILSGRIRRGDCDSINAVIWLSDMRGFTARADTLPPQILIDLLNRYFDCQIPAILDQDGEVLKFMGDGLLAIFRIPGGAESRGDGDLRRICGRVLAAACTARANVAALDGPPGRDRADSVRFGLGLHLGSVLYGNIGGGNRLDFTCIGPAVNLAARIEKLAARLGRTILASSDFAQYCGPELVPVGEFPLSGFSVPQRVFGPVDEAV
jgi:adenylate cyclase